MSGGPFGFGLLGGSDPGFVTKPEAEVQLRTLTVLEGQIRRLGQGVGATKWPLRDAVALLPTTESLRGVGVGIAATDAQMKTLDILKAIDAAEGAYGRILKAVEERREYLQAVVQG